MELRLPLEMSPGREAACRAVFGTWGFFRTMHGKTELARNPASGDRAEVRGKKQSELITVLSIRGEVGTDDIEGFSATTIKSLRDAGIIEVIEREEARANNDAFTPDVPPELMPEQAEAVRRVRDPLEAGRFEALLLHGVTGSGKTEVYLRCIASLAGTEIGRAHV